MKTKGKILKIRSGYNPNSSSIGIHVSLFIKGTAAIAGLITTILTLLMAKRSKRDKRQV